MTEPTDAELWQLHMQMPGVHKNPIDFARAVLAKWATQPAVAWRYRPSAVWDDYVLTDDTGKAARARANGLHVEALCLTTPQPTQAQAGAVPLTDEQLAEIMRETWGCASIAPRHAIGFARAIERAHGIGIKGGLHGAK